MVVGLLAWGVAVVPPILLARFVWRRLGRRDRG
jgi:hypothetical protein